MKTNTIKNRNEKAQKIAKIITTEIARINAEYRDGPSFYFYHRLRRLRTDHPCVLSFLKCDYCLEIVYATLVAWDMDSRAAKMKDFASFCKSLRGASTSLKAIENAASTFRLDQRAELLTALSNAYDQIHLMQGKAHLVSTSKCLHFLFPDICMPMDGKNTLTKLYGSANESKNKFLALTEFAFDVISGLSNAEQYLDQGWNTSAPKLVDNAIILMKV